MSNRVPNFQETFMYDPFDLASLAADCQRVISLRLWKLSWGGSAGAAEAYHMAAEKIAEAAHSTGRLILGASPATIVGSYRDVVRANLRRLSS